MPPSTKSRFQTPTPETLESYLQDFGRRFASDALDRAQELMYQAWDAGDKNSSVAITKRAIKTSPLCADAYVMLAELTTKSSTERQKLYETGVKAGELALGPHGFEEYAGHFWGFHETRPYMRARAGLAETLWQQGNHRDAVAHYWDMLDLNDDDNQGIRYILAACLLRMKDDEGLRRLLKMHKDDGSAYMLYTQALVAFRVKPNGKKAQQFAEEAIRSNTHIPEGLAGTRKIIDPQTGYYTLGGEDEAAYYLEEYGFAWQDTPGAIDWLMNVAKSAKQNSPSSTKLH